MSAKLSGKVWELEMDSVEKLVLLALADHADHDGGSIHPGNDLICAKTGLSERTVSDKISKFIQRRILIPIENGAGRGYVREYRMVLDSAPRRQSFIDRETKKVARNSTISQKGNSEKEIQGIAERHITGEGKVEPPATIGGSKVAVPATIKSQKVEADAKKVEADAKKVEADAQKVEADAQKVEADDILHDKERARPNRHEPSIEPSGESSTSGATAPQPKPRRKSKTPESGEEKIREADPCYETFCSAFARDYRAPYQHTTADFVRLAALRKTCTGNTWELTPERWAKGLENYFASDLGNHTLADLASRFSAFYRSPLDRFGKPIASVNGTGGGSGHPNGAGMLIDPNTLSPKTRGNAAALQSFIERRRK
jgi:hypothetical protein